MSKQGWSETIVTAQGDGNALTAAAAASMLPPQGRFTLPANFFSEPGKTVRVTATGRISSVITTPGTARFDLRFGGTVVFDSLAILLDSVAAYTNVGWTLDILLTCRNVGSAASLMGQGVWVCTDILGTPSSPPKAAVSAILPWNSAPAVGGTFDSTVAQQIDAFFTQTVGTGSLTLHQFAIEALN